MGVSVRVAGGVVLCLLAFLPRGADAAPIIIEQTITDPLATTGLAASFTFDNDIALFHLVFGEGDFTLTGTTTSAATGFDPILVLFDSDGVRVPYLTSDGVDSVSDSLSDIADLDVQLPLFSLVGGSTYTLAVTQYFNFPNTTLAEGFGADADEFQCFAPVVACEPGDAGMFGGKSGLFTLDLTVTSSDTAPVPEPGTLSLIAVAAAGALVRRRRARHRPENHS